MAAIRRLIREVPGAAETAAAHCTGHNYSDLGRPRIAWDDEAARERLVNALVTDTVQLLGRQPDGRTNTATGARRSSAASPGSPATAADSATEAS